jgi:hypothetical protein
VAFFIIGKERAVAKPLLVEIIAYAPTAFYHCTHCEVAWREIGVSNFAHEEQVSSSLPADLAQDYQQVSDWVKQVFQRYRDQVVIKVVDAASLEGFIKTLRYRVNEYPAIIIDRKARFPGGAFKVAGDEIARRLAKPEAASTRQVPG